MSAPVTPKDAAAATRATDAIRRLGSKDQPKVSSINEDLKRAAPKPSKGPMGLIVGALVVLIAISALGGVYLAGILNPAVSKKLAAVPVVGRYLFPDRTAKQGTTAPTSSETAGAAEPSKIPTPDVPGSQIGQALKALNEAQAKFTADQKAFQAKNEKFMKDEAALNQQKKDFEAEKTAFQAQILNLNNQVEIASNMKPAAVAQMFDGLPDDLVVQILAKMQRADAARILAALDPFHASRLYDKMGAPPAPPQG